MTNFTRAKRTLQEHNVQTTHQRAMEDAAAFMGQMESGHLSVSQQLTSQASEIVKQNRLILTSILRAIIFCGKQNISLRGHTELSNLGETSKFNPGNFIALLQLQIQSGDTVLKNHFAKTPKNAQYRSPHIQNELISAIGEWFQQTKKSRLQHFLLSVQTKQLMPPQKSNCPLFCDTLTKVVWCNEEFIEFILCDTGTSGEAIASKIKGALEYLSLNLKYLRGQSYDGAGNMAGRYQGAAAVIQRDYPRAVYFHCAAHALNLCIVAACNVQEVRNFLATLEQICLFFSFSAKRQQELTKNIEELPVGETNRKKLVSICKTRWVSRIEAFEVFHVVLPAVTNTFEIISGDRNTNAESSQKAASLLLSATQFQFVMILAVVENCLGYTKGLTVSLQSWSMDICTAYREANTVRTVLAEV